MEVVDRKGGDRMARLVMGNVPRKVAVPVTVVPKAAVPKDVVPKDVVVMGTARRHLVTETAPSGRVLRKRTSRERSARSVTRRHAAATS